MRGCISCPIISSLPLPKIFSAAVFHEVTRPSGSSVMIASWAVSSTVFSRARADILRLFEKQFIDQLLAKHHGNVSAAAKDSKMTRQNFQRLMKKFGITADRYRDTNTSG